MTKPLSAKALYEKKLAALSAEDRAEITRYAEFLCDKKIMSPKALIEKHWEYLGFKQKPAKYHPEHDDGD